MKPFFKSVSDTLMLFLVTSIIFVLIFWLLDLPWYGFWLGMGIISFSLCLLLVLRWLNYRKEVDYKQELEQAKRDIRELKNQQASNYRDLQEYFILWVHQIKTPITAAKLLVDKQGNQPVKQELLAIENYTSLAMSYLKLQEPEKEMVLDKLVLDDIIKPLLRKYSRIFIESKTQLIYDPIKEVVVTDANWMQLMVEQVLNNALKYSPGGQIHITYTPNELTIADTGIGISAEDLPKVFDKGYSGFNGQLNEKSSGLGLFIVRLISKRLDQPVTIDSVLGKGTQVKIYCHESNQTNLTKV